MRAEPDRCDLAAPSPSGTAAVTWGTPTRAWETPSPYDFAPPSIQARLLASRMPVGVDRHRVPRRPSVSGDLVRELWTSRIDVDTAVTLASICADSATLEWILGKDRRKAVRNAVLENRSLDIEVLWNPERGVWGLKDATYLDILEERIDQVNYDGLVAILAGAPTRPPTG